MTDTTQPPHDEELAERDAELGIDWSALREGLRKPAALRGMAALAIGIVALAAPRLSAWLLSLLIGIALVIVGGVEGVASLRRRPPAWHELGRSLVLFVGGLLLGVGFIIGGYCPGTSIVATTSGKVDGLLFVVGLLFGTAAFTIGYEPLADLQQQADSIAAGSMPRTRPSTVAPWWARPRTLTASGVSAGVWYIDAPCR